MRPDTLMHADNPDTAGYDRLDKHDSDTEV